MREKGISKTIMAAVIVVALVVAGVGAYFMLKGPEEGEGGEQPSGIEWFQTGNTQDITQLQSKQSNELENVEVHGYVYDIEGSPVTGVFVIAVGPPGMDYGHAITDARGYYALSFERPERLDYPIPSTRGLPIYEGCQILVAWGSNEWLPIIDILIDTENKDIIVQDFAVKPAGTVKLKAYSSNGTLIEQFPIDTSLEYPTYPAYTTDLYWRLTGGVFAHDRGMFVLSLNTPHVLNLPWTVPGFGRVILRADNDGNGFTLRRQGETITIHLNYEIAKTECRVLRESYERFPGEGYAFSEDVLPNIQSAEELLQQADSMTDNVQKALFADLSLNQTLWTAENLELERTLQDIEKCRKGNATLRLVDETGKPVQDGDVTISQITHDFLFGVDTERGREGTDSFEKHIRLETGLETGINYGLWGFFWKFTEPRLGQYDMGALPPTSELERLTKMGVRFGGDGIIVLEPGPNSWDVGLLSLTFEELKTKIYEHVYTLVSAVAPYIDYWTVIDNPHRALHYLGFTLDQNIDFIKTGVAAIKSADPPAKVLLFFDWPCGFCTTTSYQGEDQYDVDPYTYISNLDEYGIDYDGVALWITYGSVSELPPEWGSVFGGQVPYPFRDLASISRILDWYGTLSIPIHITAFNAPGDFTSNLGYWHRRSWDEELKIEWIEKFYTIAFSKQPMRQITYWFSKDADYFRTKLGLFDVSDQPRESCYALRRLLMENWTTRLHMKTDSNGQLEFRGFAGDYNITVSTKDLTTNFTIHVYEGSNNTYTLKLERVEKTWLIIPAIIAFAVGVLSGSVILYRRVRAKKRKSSQRPLSSVQA